MEEEKGKILFFAADDDDVAAWRTRTEIHIDSTCT